MKILLRRAPPRRPGRGGADLRWLTLATARPATAGTARTAPGEAPATQPDENGEGTVARTEDASAPV